MMQKVKEKTVEYFPHDYHARDDLQEVLQVLGHEGKSIYWDLVEMLYENGGYLEISKIPTYAFTLHTTAEVIEKLINEDFGLFSKDDKNFWSESALRRYAKRLEIAKQRSNAGKIGANRRWNEEPKPEEKPKRQPREKPPKADNKQFDGMKYIKLTEEQHAKIVKKWGEYKTAKMIEILDIWFDTGTKKAKEARSNQNHYAYFRADGWLSGRADEVIKKEQGNKNNAISTEYGTY